MRKWTSYFTVISIKSWSKWLPDDSFGICWSIGFQNTPCMPNLDFWLSYLELNKNFLLKIETSLQPSIYQPIPYQNESGFRILMTGRFQNCPIFWNLMTNWQIYSRLKTRLDFWKENFNKQAEKLKSSKMIISSCWGVQTYRQMNRHWWM